MIRVKVASPMAWRIGRFATNNPRATIGAVRGISGAAVGAGVGAAAAGPGNRMTGAAGGALAGGALGAGSSALVGQKGLSTMRAAGQELSADAAQRIMRGPKLADFKDKTQAAAIVLGLGGLASAAGPSVRKQMNREVHDPRLYSNIRGALGRSGT